MNSNKCKHGYDVDANGNHIIPPEKSTTELIEEAKKLLQKLETVKPKQVNEVKKFNKLLKGEY